MCPGPKGVINDWRRFKLDSVDPTVPQRKRELLRQMSNPREDDKERVNRKVRGKHTEPGGLSNVHINDHIRSDRISNIDTFTQMSAQEYELIQNEDEHGLKRYRKQCMQEMHERLSFGPKFECVHDLESGEAFLEVIEKEHRLTLVVVHIYQHGVKGQGSPLIQTINLFSPAFQPHSCPFCRL